MTLVSSQGAPLDQSVGGGVPTQEPREGRLLHLLRALSQRCVSLGTSRGDQPSSLGRGARGALR